MELDLVSNLSIKPTSPMQRTNLQNHPDSGCLPISGVVIGSALSKGSRSGPEAFRAGHFEDSKPETALKSLSHPGYDVKRSKKQIQCFVRKKTTKWQSAVQGFLLHGASILFLVVTCVDYCTFEKGIIKMVMEMFLKI